MLRNVLGSDRTTGMKANETTALGLSRSEMADAIVLRITDEHENATRAYRDTATAIGFFVIDDVLPADLARAIGDSFPEPDGLNPIRETDAFHVTSFRGRPEQRIVDPILRADAAARALVRKIKPSGVKKIDHFYKR